MEKKIFTPNNKNNNGKVVIICTMIVKICINGFQL